MRSNDFEIKIGKVTATFSSFHEFSDDVPFDFSFIIGGGGVDSLLIQTRSCKTNSH
jgi:hypothetical protein